MNSKESMVIWKEGSIDVANEALVKQIVFPVNALINANPEDDLIDLFSSKLTEEECFGLMEMNVEVEAINFKCISIKENFAVVEASVFDGIKEYGQVYFLVNENGEYRIFDCTLQAAYLRVN